MASKLSSTAWMMVWLTAQDVKAKPSKGIIDFIFVDTNVSKLQKDYRATANINKSMQESIDTGITILGQIISAATTPAATKTELTRKNDYFRSESTKFSNTANQIQQNHGREFVNIFQETKKELTELSLKLKTDPTVLENWQSTQARNNIVKLKNLYSAFQTASQALNASRNALLNDIKTASPEASNKLVAVTQNLHEGPSITDY